MKRIERAAVLFSHTNMSADDIRRETGVRPAGLVVAVIVALPAILAGRVARWLSAA